MPRLWLLLELWPSLQLLPLFPLLLSLLLLLLPLPDRISRRTSLQIWPRASQAHSLPLSQPLFQAAFRQVLQSVFQPAFQVRPAAAIRLWAAAPAPVSIWRALSV